MRPLDYLALVVVVTNILDLTHFPMWILITYIVLSSLSRDTNEMQLKEMTDKLMEKMKSKED